MNAITTELMHKCFNERMNESTDELMDECVD